MDKNTEKRRMYKVQPVFSAATYKALQLQAKEEGRSMANMVVRFVEQGLDALEAKKNG